MQIRQLNLFFDACYNPDQFALFLFKKITDIILISNKCFRQQRCDMRWLSEYNTGIEVIDDQHQRILEYINELEEVRKTHDRAQVKDVLLNLIDYTQSHFAFEESLQEEANYKYRVPHKRVHDLFIKKIEHYRERFEMGHDVEEELYEVLSKWLINHIQHDDADYVGAVKENMMGIIKEKEQKKGKGWFARFFS